MRLSWYRASDIYRHLSEHGCVQVEQTFSDGTAWLTRDGHEFSFPTPDEGVDGFHCFECEVIDHIAAHSVIGFTFSSLKRYPERTAYPVAVAYP